ncbi:MAG: DUF4893 domain-containing protein [Brevundimonas sp.]|uniref:DUF4893 domain-containing protein n=1 Tax=Brevundimonas sp. TaxID=1871086 RepID=UPI00258AFB14|nr:DUF4893 domain-containing protein [Brevundimonas sp.]MCV0414584.1 DUF4893 domain-containing protein [Brevundimonas sp.]
MRRSPTALISVLALTAGLGVALAACGENSPSTPAETSPAVSAPAAGVPGQAAPQAAATPEQAAAPAADATAAPAGAQGGTDDWRQVASAADASLLGRLDQAWRMARAEAEDAGFADEVERLGALVDPNAGLAGRLQPAPGAYRCRTIKLGRRTEGQGLAYVAYPYFRCTVELTPGGDLFLTKSTGSQRTQGLLYPDTDRRLVYVGAQAWGDEAHFPRYGQTRERDQVGVFERIGDQRWRLVLPWPKQESKLELLEVVR